jgi:flagellar biosynthesis protein FliP
MNWKGYGTERSWSNLRYCPEILVEGLRKTTNLSIQTEDIPSKKNAKHSATTFDLFLLLSLLLLLLLLVVDFVAVVIVIAVTDADVITKLSSKNLKGRDHLEYLDVTVD